MFERTENWYCLRSGGARGLAHIGVLKVLEEENTDPLYCRFKHCSLIASFYAAGQDIERMLKISQAFKRKYFIDVKVPKLGFIQGNRIKEFIRLFTYNKELRN